MYIWIVSLSADRGLLTQNLIPYSEWADADLLQVLAEKASDTSPEARNERLEILSELANRPQAKRGQAYFALLMDLARRYANLPEENLLSQLMKDACLGDNQLVISLLNEFRDPKISPHLVACAAKVIRGLPSDAKHRSLRYLTDCLLAQSSTTAVTNAIVDLLRSMDEPELSRETAVTLSPYLLKADPVPVSAA